jgi:signal transduction histidine kinase
VSDGSCGLVRAGLAQAVAFARSAEPRTPLSRRAVLTDTVIAALVLVVSLVIAKLSRWPGGLMQDPRTGAMIVTPGQVLSIGDVVRHELVPIVLLSVPLAARRALPLTAFGVLALGALATRQYATDITFLAIVFAGYSAVAYSRFRNAALLSVPLAGVIVAAAFWTAAPATSAGSAIPGQALPVAQPPGFMVTYPWRLPGLLVAASLVLIAVVASAVQARDRTLRLRAEHEAATRRALEQERARIARELHDVVTHNVSMMVVQAGAARQVLTDSPDEATKALRAVESSGRAAMTELRHLLGLLSPAPEATDFGEPPGPTGVSLGNSSGTNDAAALVPQPGLDEVRSLVGRAASAGLPVELHVIGTPRDLPPGQGLAAFRVVQEALTNVIKHVGKPRTDVRLSYEPAGLVVEVADNGPAPDASRASLPGGAGMGLLGLRERVALYGGEFDAGPRPGGGWLVRARIPADPAQIPAEVVPL